MFDGALILNQMLHVICLSLSYYRRMKWIFLLYSTLPNLPLATTFQWAQAVVLALWIWLWASNPIHKSCLTIWLPFEQPPQFEHPSQQFHFPLETLSQFRHPPQLCNCSWIVLWKSSPIRSAFPTCFVFLWKFLLNSVFLSNSVMLLLNSSPSHNSFLTM